MLYQLGELRPRTPLSGAIFLAPNAAVIGNVILGEDVSFWFGAVARGDNEPMRIGAHTNIQDGAVLHSDPGVPLTIGEGCTIGHQAVLHGCTVGDNTLIGIGAVVLNRARIGRNCLIGARALVTEGKEIPDNSLVIGAPGKVARSLSDDEIEGLRRGARNYVENARRFLGGLQPITR